MASRSQNPPQGQQPKRYAMCFICADIVSDAEEQQALFYRDEHTEMTNTGVELCQACYQDYLTGRLKLDFHLNGLG